MSYTELFSELVRVEIELWNALDAQLRVSADVTLAQFQALASIRDTAGPARVQDISAAMSITVGATSKLVDRLERDGLAVRSANPDDRRSSVIRLSDKGASALEAADLAAETHLRGAVGGAFPADRAERLLGELIALRSYSREDSTTATAG